jgi:NAD-dependent deacetylase
MSAAAARLSALLSPARRVVIFTGAGVSTESGIPDFRSPGGLWSQIKPIRYQEFVASEDIRRASWTRTFTGIARWTGSKPNEGHRAVAQLITGGRASCVITQNVDNLHQDGGAPQDRVIELHGNASYASCLACGLRHELEDLRGPFEIMGDIPACRACAGIVKTAVVSFGQAMPPGVMERARAEAMAADLFLVLGSSLTVVPAASLPAAAVGAGVPLAIVNREPTPQDDYAELVLHEEIGPLMNEVMQILAPEPCNDMGVNGVA